MNYIHYSLPKSVFSHKIIGAKDPTNAFSVLLKWLETYTEYRVEGKVSLNLAVPIKNFEDQRFNALSKTLGEHTVKGEIRDYLAQKKTAEMWTFSSSYSKIKNLLDLVRSNHNLLKEFRYFISFTINFILKDSNGNVLKGQSLDGKEKSNFYVYLSENSALSPNIYFPFDYRQEFLKFFEYFSNHIPLKMNKKHLRIFIENTKTDKGIFKKLPFNSQ